jgi:phosphonate transport system substrate-binding protein
LPYVDLMDLPEPPVELLAAPVLVGERYGGRPIYFSDVIVRRDSPIHCFAELRGRSWTYNDTASHSGYNLTRYQLLRAGETGGSTPRRSTRRSWRSSYATTRRSPIGCG